MISIGIMIGGMVLFVIVVIMAMTVIYHDQILIKKKFVSLIFCFINNDG